MGAPLLTKRKRVCLCQKKRKADTAANEKMERDGFAPAAPGPKSTQTVPQTTDSTPLPLPPDAEDKVDLKCLLTDFSYQFIVRDAFGEDGLSRLMDKARQMKCPPQEVKHNKKGTIGLSSAIAALLATYSFALLTTTLNQYSALTFKYSAFCHLIIALFILFCYYYLFRLLGNRVLRINKELCFYKDYITIIDEIGDETHNSRKEC